ncbi:MAG: IS3 family transposase [Holdemania massiliensis]
MIDRTLKSKGNPLTISYLCESAGVSRSGYYAWAKRKDAPGSYPCQKEAQDEKDFELILEAFKDRKCDKGRRSIHMWLLHKKGILMNEKKVSRLMKKYKLFCPIRKANPTRRMMKALKSSNVAKNLLERRFEEYGPGYVLLTDITYFFYSASRRKAYLSVVKDAFTKQILAYVLSESFEEDFVLETIEQLYKNPNTTIHTDAMIHSDQGSHYTSHRFIQLLKDKELRQSMSRRGNCWDNAPQESFFGHMKDEIGEYFKDIEEFEKLKGTVDEYMDYYNNERHQYALAKLSPNMFYEYYKTGKYPLIDLVKEPVKIIEKFKKAREFQQGLSSTSESSLSNDSSSNRIQDKDSPVSIIVATR